MKKNYFTLTTITFFALVYVQNSFAQSTAPLSHSETTKTNLTKLPWTESEIRQIGHHFDSKLFLFDRATEFNFKKFAPNSRIVHIASHATINDQNPMYSKFIFSPRNADSLNDNLLYAFELYNMRLNNELAVLSACNTGTGKLIRGEGIMSLAHGFRYAGCENILMSLWQVDDKSTNVIMNHFYQNLKSGEGKAEALRNAKLSFLKQATPIHAHPHFWSGFIMIGDNVPLSFKDSRSNWFRVVMIIIFTLSFLLTLFFVIRKRKKVTSKGQKFFLLLLIITALLVSFQDCQQENSLPKQSTVNQLAQNDPVENLSRADRYFEKARYDSSILYYQKASHEFYDQKNWEKYAQCLNDIGENFTKLSEYDSASVYLNRALQTSLKKLPKATIVLSSIYQNLGTLKRQQGSSKEAINYYQKALNQVHLSDDDSEDILTEIYLNYAIALYHLGALKEADSLNALSISIRNQISGEKDIPIDHNYNLAGLICAEQGDFDGALKNHQQALALRQDKFPTAHPDIAQSYLNIGVIDYQKGDYQSAAENYQQALKIKQHFFGEKNISVAGLYLNLGVVHKMRSDFHKAINYYFKSLSILDDLTGEKHALVADNYTNIGISYRNLKQFDKALKYYQKALPVYSKKFGAEHARIANLYLNIGILYSIMEKHSNSIEYLSKSLAMGKKLFSETHPHVAFTHLNMAVEYLRSGNLKKANSNLQKALLLGLKIYGQRHPFIGEVYQQYGQLYEQQGKLDEALNLYQKSLIALSFDFKDQDIFKNPGTSNLPDEKRFLKTLTLKANAFETLYKSDLKTNNLKTALSIYKLATELVNKMYSNYNAQESKLFLSEESHDIYARAVPAVYELFKLQNNLAVKNDLFYFIESSKSNLLKEALMDTRVMKYANIPDSLLKLEAKLQVDISHYQQQIFNLKLKQQDESEQVQKLKNKLIAAEQQQEQLMHHFETNFPQYYQLKFSNDMANIKMIQKHLSENNATVLEYFLSDKNLYCLVISEDEVHIHRTDLDSIFYESIDKFRDALFDSKSTAFIKHGFYLYSKLIQPIEPKIRTDNLIIIPDGPLGYIPFEALLTRESDSINSQDHPYLLKKHVISYNYLASLLTNQNKKADFRFDIVGFAPVNF